MRLRFPLLLIILFSSLSVSAAESRHVTPTLISENASIAPGQTFWVALRMTMQDRWHIYWKNPGDSGAPVKISWTLPEGFSTGEIQWPYPELIVAPPVYTYGYEKEAVLLVPLTAPASLKPGDKVELKARVRWLECEVECIPAEARLAFTIPATLTAVAPDEATAKFFAAARGQLPLKDAGWTFSAGQDAGVVRLSVSPPAWAENEISNARFFAADPDLFRYDAPQAWKRTKAGYSIDLARSDISSAPVAAVRGVLVSDMGWRGKGSERALEVNVPVDGKPAGAGSAGLLAALLLAFVGGMILNLMPCVLPVLSIKVLSLVQQAGMTTAVRLRHGLAYTAGVLVTFLSLAGTLLLLRAGGRQLGWGFQLQSPGIVIVLASLLFLLSLSLFGVFEIGASLTQLGGAPKKEGYGGSFASGFLATLVATPCTAPFMGSALGFALTQPPLASLSVFCSIALGLALPYVVLTASPALLKWVPRPGAWMESMKQGLGFLMAASVVWLLWVLGRQAGPDVVVGACAAFVLQGAGAWIYGRWSLPHRTATVRAVATMLALAFVVGGTLFAISVKGQAPTSAANSSGGIAWEPYSAERVAELRAAGRPVFVDFTAAWCLTCQVNARVAIDKADVIAKIKEKNIAALKADWTSRDPKITAALAALGRSGVPAYVFYPSDPSSPPKVLPEVLTPAILLSAFDAAK